MNPILILSIVEQLVQDEPAIQAAIVNVLTKPNPTTADWQAEREKVEAMTPPIVETGKVIPAPLPAATPPTALTPASTPPVAGTAGTPAVDLPTPAVVLSAESGPTNPTPPPPPPAKPAIPTPAAGCVLRVISTIEHLSTDKTTWLADLVLTDDTNRWELPNFNHGGIIPGTLVAGRDFDVASLEYVKPVEPGSVTQ